VKKLSWFYKYLIFKFRIKIDIDQQFLDHKSLDNLFNHFGSDKGTKVRNPYNIIRIPKNFLVMGFPNTMKKILNIFKIKNLIF
jgi:hypothetical protein